MKARTIAEVVAGEMSYKGDQASQWGDALGIASTIANRAKAYGVSPEDVISAPGQYQAYGKSLPKGVGAAQIARAQKALDTVAQYGPVTPATHYALPSATKNIKGWNSFKQVDQVPGSHVFAIDPQMRAIRTATGVVQAQPNAFEGLMNTARVGAIAVARSVAQAPQAAAAMAKQGFDVVTGRNTFPAAPGYSDIDQVGGLLGLRGKMQDIKGVTVHHTGKMPPGATAADVVNVLNTRTNKRGQPVKYGAHFVVDQQGVPHQIAPMGTKVWHMQDDVRGLRLSNENMIGIEVMAANDAALTPAQIKGTMALMDKLKADNPDLKAYGHGFLNTHKDPEEGSTIARAFNNMQANKAKAPEFARREALENIKDTGQPLGRLSTLDAEQSMAPSLMNAAYGDEPGNIGPATVNDMMTGRNMPVSPAPAAAAPTAQKSYYDPAKEYAYAGLTQSLAPATPVGGSQPVVGSSQPLVGGAPKQARVGTGPFTQAPPQPIPERFGPTTAPAPTRSIAAIPADPRQVALTNMPQPKPAPPAAAIPADPRQTAFANMPPTEKTPSLVDVGAAVADQPAPALAEPTVVADKPIVETVQTVKQTRPAPTIGPVQTVAPAPPAQPSGFFGSLSKPFRNLADLAGPVPSPKSFDYGTGAQAINDALSGATQSKPGAVSYSKSTPGYSIKSLGNGMVEKTNQYGAKSYERVGTPGSGIFSGQPTTGGLLSNFGLGGVSMPSVGGFFNAMNSPFGSGPNTANVGASQMGYAGPWGAGTPTGIGGFMSGIGKAVGGFFGGGVQGGGTASRSSGGKSAGSGRSTGGAGHSKSTRF